MEAKERQYYVLLSALCTTYTQSIDQQIAKWINPHYLKVLEYIRKHEGVKPSELAEVFRMSKSNVTKIVSYLCTMILLSGRSNRRTAAACI